MINSAAPRIPGLRLATAYLAPRLGLYFRVRLNPYRDFRDPTAMPIYAYRCQDCGFEKDQLQKLSDAPLTVCPSCSGNGFARKLTAPAFQLKGSGWYVTDFRDGGQKKAGAEGAAEGGEAAGDKASDKPAGADTGAGSETAKSDSSPTPAAAGAPASKPADSGAAKTASAASSPAPKPASPSASGASA